MCGLFGATSGCLSDPEIKRVEMLGVLSQFRGTDSTGLAIASACGKKGRNTEYNLYKDTMDSSGFLLHPELAKAIDRLGTVRTMVGHCRAATHGSVTKENAHPYHCGHLIGAHNGTIQALAPDKGQPGTDSLELYRRIATDGLDATIRDIHYGAFALTWIDTSNNTVNLLRNEQRELWVMRHTVSRTIYWASEKLFLTFMRDREKLAIDDSDIILLKPFILHTINIGSIEAQTREIERPNPTVRTTPAIAACRSPWNSWENELEEPSKPTKSAMESASVLMPESREDYDKIIRSLDEDITKKKAPLSLPAPTLEQKRESLIKNEHTIVPCTLIAPTPTGPVDKFPYPPSVVRGMVTKVLRYRGYGRKLYNPHDLHLQKLLADGCAVSGVIAQPWEKVLWLDEDTYIFPQFKSNEFIFQFYGNALDSSVDSVLAYYPPSAIHNANRKMN